MPGHPPDVTRPRTPVAPGRNLVGFRAEFASLLLVANQWAQNGKPTFTGAPTTTTTRPSPTTTTTRPAPTTTTTRPAPTTTEPASSPERQALAALLDSALWRTSPTDVLDWSDEQVTTVGEEALDDIYAMFAEVRRIDEEWAALDLKKATDRMMRWWWDVRDGLYKARLHLQRPELEEIILGFDNRSQGVEMQSWVYHDTFFG